MDIKEQTYFDEPDNFMKVSHLTIHGTNRQIGQELTELAVERYGLGSDSFVADPIYAKTRLEYFQDNYPVNAERIAGVATTLGINPNDTRYDFSNLWYNVFPPSPRVGCSVVYYPPSVTANNSGYLSRNYDFYLGTMAEVMHMPLPPDAVERIPPVMSEPYVMEWYPEDGSYASLAIHTFDILSGTLDGINSEGLVVSILADEEAITELRTNLEVHPGAPHIIGLNELQVMRFVLDTCATVDEAKKALLETKQYYAFLPLHYIVADKAGNSFIYENSTWRNIQYIIDGKGQPQVVTNFQIHKHPTLDQMPTEELTLETNAFWRYKTLVDRLSKSNERFTPEELKEINACVNVMKVHEALDSNQTSGNIAANAQGRTLWHSLYNQQDGTAEFSFYLGDEINIDGTVTERRSDYIKFALES